MVNVPNEIQLIIIIILAPMNLYNVIKGLTIKCSLFDELCPAIKKITIGWLLVWSCITIVWFGYAESQTGMVTAFTALSIFYPIILLVWEFDEYEFNSLLMKVLYKLIFKKWEEDKDRT